MGLTVSDGVRRASRMPARKCATCKVCGQEYYMFHRCQGEPNAGQVWAEREDVETDRMIGIDRFDTTYGKQEI